MKKIVGLEFLKSLCRWGEKPIGIFFRLGLDFPKQRLMMVTR